MFFVTFHQKVDNVYAYDDDGNQLSSGVLDKPGDELRGIYLRGSVLYVVQGGKKASRISCYEGSGTSYKWTNDFVTQGGAIDHPFAFDGRDLYYISNQNTNVVAAYVSLDGLTATPAPEIASCLTALYPAGKFLPGTFVASAQSDLPGASQTSGLTAVLKQLGGLDVAIDKKQGKVQNSVRDVAFYHSADGGQPTPLLFVADEPAGLVRLYDARTGQILRSSNPLKSPVHLLVEGETIYVGAGGQVFSSPVPDPFDPHAPTWVFEAVNLQPPVPSGQSVSGMAFDAAGNFHVAVRTNQTVWKYDSTFASGVEWACGAMKDDPEFLLYVAD